MNETPKIMSALQASCAGIGPRPCGLGYRISARWACGIIALCAMTVTSSVGWAFRDRRARRFHSAGVVGYRISARWARGIIALCAMTVTGSGPLGLSGRRQRRI